MPDSNLGSLDWFDIDLRYFAHDDVTRSEFVAVLTPRNENIGMVAQPFKKVILCLLDLQ